MVEGKDTSARLPQTTMSSIGPQLPPHLLAAAANAHASDDEDDSEGPSPGPSAPAAIGPAMPPPTMKPPAAPAPAPAAEVDSDDDYTPALPPGFSAQPPASRPAAGPARASSGRVVGPTMPHHSARHEDDDSEDEIGPSPVPVGPVVQRNAAAEFRAREESRRKALEVRPHVSLALPTHTHRNIRTPQNRKSSSVTNGCSNLPRLPTCSAVQSVQTTSSTCPNDVPQTSTPRKSFEAGEGSTRRPKHLQPTARLERPLSGQKRPPNASNDSWTRYRASASGWRTRSPKPHAEKISRMRNGGGPRRMSDVVWTSTRFVRSSSLPSCSLIRSCREANAATRLSSSIRRLRPPRSPTRMACRQQFGITVAIWLCLGASWTTSNATASSRTRRASVTALERGREVVSCESFLARLPAVTGLVLLQPDAVLCT
jgi:hypothetical protein